MKIFYKILINFCFLNELKQVRSIVIPRFDLREKEGIIFSPLVPRAGQSLTVECSLVGLSPENVKSVSWKLKRFNDGKEFYLATNNDVFQFRNPVPRLFSFHELNSKKWQIKFDPLDRDDLGNLTCFLSDTGNIHVSLTRFLNVYSEPIILYSSTKDTEVDLGSNINLICNSQGYPDPSVFWIRADNKPLSNGFVTHKGHVLTIKNVTSEDRGVYKCLATNFIGSGSEWTIKLSVRFPPRVQCQRSIGQAPNFEVDAYMECYVYGYPPPRLSWYKQLDPKSPKTLTLLTQNYKYKFEAIIPEPEICIDCILARITIINVVSRDYGYYVLRANSEQFLGLYSQDKVKLYETPECQQSITNYDKACRNVPKV